MSRNRASYFYNKFHNKSSIQTKVIRENNFTYRYAIDEFKKWIEGDGLRILDFGCGVGTLSFYLASNGNKVTGVDISEKAILLARKSVKKIFITNLIDFKVLDEWEPSKCKGKYNVIVSIEVIEHVPDDSKILLILFSCLKRGGKLILSTPSINAPLHRLGLAKEFDKKVGHLRRYDYNELIKKVSDAGFKVEEIKKTEGILRNSLFLFPLLGKLVKFIKGPISDIVTFIDNITIPLFGESNLYVVATKE